MIFMGALFRKEDEERLLKLSKVGITNAANTFQWNIIEGLRANGNTDIHIINALPVGTWPKCYKKTILKDKTWEYSNNKCYEIGCINIPFLKQLIRTIKTKRVIRKLTKTENEIVIYSTYIPFLKSLYKLPSSVKITAIITDLPEYYDLSRSSKIKKVLLKIQTKIMYKYLERVDRFVILTEQMKEPLNLKSKPYTVIEGIYNDSNCHDRHDTSEQNIVFYSGSLKYQFGIKTLLEAFSRISDKNARLWICGAGEAENEIKEMSKEDDRIKFFGFLPLSEVEKLRSQASVLVNPRTNDGEYTKYSFPSKTMEYMASGIPVVMYKLDGIPDEYDEHLFYVKDNTVDSLAQTISRVLMLPKSEQIAFGEKAKEFVLKNKNKKTQAMKIIKLIEVKNADHT